MQASQPFIPPSTTIHLLDAEGPKPPNIIRVKIGSRNFSFSPNGNIELSPLDVLAEASSQRPSIQIRQISDSILANISAAQIESAVATLLNSPPLSERTWLKVTNLSPASAKIVATALCSSECKITALILDNIEMLVARELAYALVNPYCNITVLRLRNLLPQSFHAFAFALCVLDCKVSALVLEDLLPESVLSFCDTLHQLSPRIITVDFANISNATVLDILHRCWGLQGKGSRKIQAEAHCVIAQVSAVVSQFNQHMPDPSQDYSVTLEQEHNVKKRSNLVIIKDPTDLKKKK
jgi:hypothetical protein